MLIKIRHVQSGDSIDFTKGDLDQLKDLAELVDQQGVYCDFSGSEERLYDWQFVLERNEAYAELIVGRAE